MISSLVGESGFGPSRLPANGSGGDGHVLRPLVIASGCSFSWRCASARPILGVLSGNELGLRDARFFTGKGRVGSHL